MAMVHGRFLVPALIVLFYAAFAAAGTYRYRLKSSKTNESVRNSRLAV